MHCDAQVVTVYRLLEQLPLVATEVFMQHELAHAAEARQHHAAPSEQQWQQLQQQFLQHKQALHPGMAQPNR